MASVAVSPGLAGLAATPFSGGIKRKRVDHSPHDVDSGIASSQPLSSPTKKPRVRFDLEADILEIDDDKPFDLVREEVRRGLENHAIGDDKDYHKLQDWFVVKSSAGETPKSELLRKYVIALTGSIRSLDRSCNAFVNILLESDWLGRDEEYVAAFIRFLGTLVSAHGAHLRRVLEMLVGKFVDLSTSAGQVQRHELVDCAQLHGRVHRALKSLLGLNPAASATLSRVLADSYPFSKDSTKTHVEFVSNILKIVEYAPEMRNFILGLLTERIVKLDLEIQDELDEDFEERADEVMHEILTQSAEKATEEDISDNESDASVDSDQEDEQEQEADLTEEQRKFMSFKESVEKLDALLDLLFGYYDSIFQKGPSYSATDVFEHMMTQFKHNILPTHHSRYTQFIIFHFAQTDEQYVDRFVEVCWSVIADKSRPVMLRLAASSYLGSFIARGAKVSTDVVRYSVEILFGYLNVQRQKSELLATGPDLHRFASFYATFQVLMYIFCFRWRALLRTADPYDSDDEETVMEIVYHRKESHWLPGLRESMTSASASLLNPLKMCAPGIVEQFAKVSHNFNFIRAGHILQRNKFVKVIRPTVEAAAAVSARETALSGSVGDLLQLDDYFPFDPYHLPKSKRWLHGDYAEWEDPEGLRGEDEDPNAPHNRDSSEERQKLAAAADGEDDDVDEDSESEYDSD